MNASTAVHEHPWLAISFLLVLVLGLVVVLFIGRSDGTPNYISGKILSIQGIDRKKQVYITVSLSTGHQIKRTHGVYGVPGLFNSKFRYALPIQALKSSEFVIFEVFSSNEEKSLGSCEISMDVLLERFPEVLTRDLKSSAFSLSLSVGLSSVHSLFLHFDRFKRALLHNLRLVSFWTRLFALPVAVWIAYDGLLRFRKHNSTKAHVQGLGQTLLGLYFLWFSVPFYLGYMGIALLDKFRNESLTFAWGSAVSISGYLGATHTWLLKPEEVGVVQKLVHVPLALVAAGYLVADVRGEPGAGWLAWVGKTVLGRFAYKGEKL